MQLCFFVAKRGSECEHTTLSFVYLLIGVEGAKTPAGAAGQVRPRRSKATRRLSASPAESEAPGTEINSPVSQQDQNKKTVNKLNFHRVCLQSEHSC
jgi:hypothetical protein